jgi:hypothetical protein
MLIGVPRIDVVVSNSAAGGLLRAYFSQRFLGVVPQTRLCQGVLVVPIDAADHLRGRARHAARNNVRRAALAGITCAMLDDPATAQRAAETVLASRGDLMAADDAAQLAAYWSCLFGHPGVTAMVARDRCGTPVGAMAIVIDDQVALIRLAVAGRHDARWALHDYLVRVLIDRGVRYLLAADGGPFGALGLDPNIQYFQQLLGYDVCHIAPRTRHR